MPSLLPREFRQLDRPLVTSSLLDRIEGAPAARTPPPLRPPREEIERRVAAARRRRAQEKKAAAASRPLPELGPAPLDEEIRVYNKELARKIAETGQSDGIAPILKNALRHDREAAAPQVGHLLGELRRQAPEQAAALERELEGRRQRPRRRVSGTAPDASLYMEFPDMPEITEAENVGFWESFIPNVRIGMTSDPWEEAQIIQEHFPEDVGGLREDKFGNPIITFRGTDYYINKPGFSLQDVGTITNAIGMATVGGRVMPVVARGAGRLISGSGHGPGTGSGMGGLVAAARLQTAPIAGQQGTSEPPPAQSPYTDIADPQPSSPPPSTPPEPGEGSQVLVNVPPDLKELLSQIPPTPGFTPADIDDIVEIFPDQRDEFPDSIIVESRGNDNTQDKLQRLAEMAQECIEEGGYKDFFKHTGGAKGVGKKIGPNEREVEDIVKETYLPNADRKNANLDARLGSSRTDLTFFNERNNRSLFINSVDTLADGLTETSRERNAAYRILMNGGSGDITLLVPKLFENEEFDREAMKSLLCTLIEELLEDGPKDDPRETKSPDELIRRMRKRPARTS